MNMETKCDICDVMLGYHWQWEVKVLDGAAAGIPLHQASHISSLLNFVVDRVFRLISAYTESDVVALGSIMSPDLAREHFQYACRRHSFGSIFI